MSEGKYVSGEKGCRARFALFTIRENRRYWAAVSAPLKAALSSGSTASAAGSSAAAAGSAASTTATATSTAAEVEEGAVAASGALSATEAVAGGQYAQEAGHYQAQVLKQQASAEQAAAGAKISAQDIEASREISTVAARAGGSGITADSVNPVLTEDYTEAKMRDAYTRYSGKLASSQDLYAATLASQKGAQLNAAGQAGGVQSLLGAAGGIGEIELGG